MSSTADLTTYGEGLEIIVERLDREPLRPILVPLVSHATNEFSRLRIVATHSHGTVTFKDGATTLGAGTLSGGKVTFKTSTLSVATHSISAVYAGSTSFAGSTSPILSQVVNQ